MREGRVVREGEGGGVCGGRVSGGRVREGGLRGRGRVGGAWVRVRGRSEEWRGLMRRGVWEGREGEEGSG